MNGKKVWSGKEEKSIWDRLQITEYEVWQDIIEAKALFLAYDLSKFKNPRYLTGGMKTLVNALQFYTRDANAAY